VLGIPGPAVDELTGPYPLGIAGLVRASGHLTVFAIGGIMPGITISTFCDAIKRISSKRGPRQFHCRISKYLGESHKPGDICEDLQTNLRRIFEKNPYLEIIELAFCSSNFEIFFETHKWAE